MRTRTGEVRPLFNRGGGGDWEIVATLKQRWRCCQIYNETGVLMSQCIFANRGGKVLYCATLEDFNRGRTGVRGGAFLPLKLSSACAGGERPNLCMRRWGGKVWECY